MQPTRILKVVLFSLCFLATTTASFAQTEVIYTGKLMGYFRTPNDQPRNATRGCSASDKSPAASSFQQFRAQNPHAILVGTGDNFAPELEARIFNDRTQGAKYRPGNKELYYWSEEYKDWIYFEDLDQPKNRALKARLELGRATIPTDNVGCFLAGARFAAVVPGKHDFYFGPERVRELARFMATLSPEDMKGYGFDSSYRPPQMLGANLVIKTSQTEPPSPVTSKPKSKWPDETSIKNLGDGKSVYPWFTSIVRVQVPAPSSLSISKALKNEFRRHEHVSRDLLETFLMDKIRNLADPNHDDWIKLHDSLGQSTDIWICPPQGPHAEMLCEGGWQIGTTSLSTSVTATASEKVLAQLKDWFIANKVFFARDGFQAFLQKNLADANQNDKDAWQKLSKGFSQLDAKVIKVCPTNKLNEVAADCKSGWAVQELGLAQDDGGINLSIRVVPNPTQPLPPDWPKDKPIPVLEPGWNYGLCQVKPGSANDDIETICQTFSVLTPFFSFSRVASMKGPDYKDPDPFVFIRPDADPEHEVAIFGVVDPNITQRIGVLNYSWLNVDEKLKTVVSAENPAEALKEQLDYFDSWYETANNQRKFSGLKILLAQMSPQQAKLLAARFKKFQLVVTEADQEQATSEATLSTAWRKDGPAGAFIAVPAPYYVSEQKKELEGTVHFGMVDAQLTAPDTWKLKSISPTPVEVGGESMEAKDLAEIILPSLKTCGAALPDNDHLPKPADVIKWAALCAMRDRLRADVALIQKRDLFDRVPLSADRTDTQKLLDRMIWKGDLLTLIYVPGSALKKSLDLSKKYDNDDSDNLSLSDEKLRGLEFLGIKKNDKGDYLINEAPLDDNKIYAVATTDYIGAGDTGYPDLATAALDPKTRAGQFPDELELISALVCRKLNPGDPEAKCVSAMPRRDYLDEIADAAPVPRKPGFMSKLSYLNPFKAPDKTPWKDNIGDVLDKRVQQRTIWMLSLKNFSVQFSGLNNNDTDASIDSKYGGISTSGVNAHENHSITVGLDLRAVRSKHNYDLFGATGIDYNSKSTDTSSTAPHVVQATNRLTGDVGVVWNLWGGRSAVRWGPVFTLHSETQVAQPFTKFDLNTTSTDAAGRTITDQLKVSHDRSVQLLARIGLRSQNRTNGFEFGFEKGREFNVFKGYEFVTNNMTVRCNPDATKSVDKCIKDAIKAGTITKDSVVLSAQQDRPRAGFYWKWNVSIPFHEKVKFELTDEGDFYFADSARDILTDTRFRDLSKSSLKFTIFPNFSIGPSLQLLLYRNQTGLDSNFQPIGGDFLSQKTFGLEASFSFNWFNRREAGVQIKHKP